MWRSYCILRLFSPCSTMFSGKNPLGSSPKHANEVETLLRSLFTVLKYCVNDNIPTLCLRDGIMSLLSNTDCSWYSACETVKCVERQAHHPTCNRGENKKIYGCFASFSFPVYTHRNSSILLSCSSYGVNN